METIKTNVLFMVSISNLDDTSGYDDVFDSISKYEEYIAEQSQVILNGVLSYDKARFIVREFCLTDEQLKKVEGWTATAFIDNFYEFWENSKEIEKLPIDYLALGHYHSYVSADIGKRATAVYCGTPEGRGFDEAGDKGYVVIDTDGKFITHRFKAAACRSIRIIDVDISTASRQIEIEDRVESALRDASKNDVPRGTCGYKV